LQIGKPAHASPARDGAPKILLVDDEDVVRRAARLSLEKYGYVVMTAEDGEQAIELFRSRGDEIGLVLLDLTMPGISGEQTLLALREIRPDVVVLATSGYSEAEAMGRFGEGAAAYIQKPYTADQLAAKVAQTMALKKFHSTGGC
jgi:CheY-like chemotaxis protein